MTERLQIIQGDCAKVMSVLPEGSVDLCVTSPPYDKIREYNGFEFSFEDIARQLYRVLAPGGVVCWNVNDATIDGSETLTSFKQAIFFKDVCGFNVETMIYEKSNGSKPNPYRYNQHFEYIFVLSKGKPRVFNPIKDKKNVTFGKGVFGRHTMREADGSMTLRKNRVIAAEYGMRGNVWRGNTRGQEDVCEPLPHPAMMPKWLARDLIISFSNVGDLVMDCMAGSGTTGMVAIGLGRRALMIDCDPEYCELMRHQCAVTPGLPL